MSLGRPMSRTLQRFCRAVMVLNYLPRYGRTYSWNSELHRPDHRATWRFTWFGYWGLNILGKLNLLFWYVDTVEGRIRDDRRDQREK